MPIPPFFRQGAALVCDVALLAGVLLAIAVTFSGGGEFVLWQRYVRIHAPDRTLAVIAALACVRLWLLDRPPFLGLGSLEIDGLRRRAARGVERLEAWSTSLPQRELSQFVSVCLMASLALRLLNAYVHFGFFSGDDVEIHEMTFALLFHKPWPIWGLRSPFYPVVFIYPVQALLVWMGTTGTASLVFAARAIVATLSSLGVLVLYRAVRRVDGPQVALFAAVILAFSRLQLEFGGTELPRPVSTVFVVGAYGLLLSRMWRSTVTAGALLGIAAAMRFSEIVFVVPAVVQLLFERRRGHAAACLAAAVALAAGIQLAGDLAYWGQPFYSLRNIIDYTFVHRLSSRGYQPVWYYVTHVTDWSDLVIVTLAVYGTSRDTWRAAVWGWGTVLILSLFPHKEPRYVIPVVPFMALLAANGLSRALTQIAAVFRARPSAWSQNLPALLLLALLCAGLLGLQGIHFRRSESAVSFARHLPEAVDVKGIAIEQAWTLGGRLYFRDALVVDLDPARIAEPDYLRRAVAGSALDTVVLKQQTCGALSCAEVLHQVGYDEMTSTSATLANLHVFRRRRDMGQIR